MKSYQDFLKSKEITCHAVGIDPLPVHKRAFDFQRDFVHWALRRGRSCLFEDCGLGKTLQSIEWAKQIPGDVLIVAPLNVAQQTIREGQKLDCEICYCRRTEDFGPGISICNYEMLEKLDVRRFKGVVLDESSILKNFDGKTRNLILSMFAKTQYKLACTATPAPNDHVELGNHAEFVGAMSRTEMLSMFFVHDGGETSKWRLKGHAEQDFWKWVCSWAVMLRKPSDLDYDDGGFKLPPLNMVEHIVQASKPMDGYLLPMPASTLSERRDARRASLNERVDLAVDLAHSNSEQWVFWCNLNSESEALAKSIGASEITGSTPMEERQEICDKFLSGEIRHVVTKPSLWGFGLNLQNCYNTACVGISDSYEELYQLIRRFWRFGQTKPVNAHIIISDMEGAVLSNIKRKEADADRMASEMVKHMSDITKKELKGITRTSDEYKEKVVTGENFTLHLGDCVEVMKTIETESVHFSIFSPPFASLYTYSASDRDMGNARNYDEFGEHIGFMVDELFRVMKPGRLVSFHCMNLPTSKTHHGYIGLQDFRGDLIRCFQKREFIFHSEVVIWKDPVTAMQRTKAIGLLHKQMVKDSCMSRQGIPDYVVTMRKPGTNPEPVAGELDRYVGDGTLEAQFQQRLDEWSKLSKQWDSWSPDEQSKYRMEQGGWDFGYDADWTPERSKPHSIRRSIEIWQKYASPVWMDINPSRTLQKDSARDYKDERHICPLQLDVIDRCLMLWSNPGDTVLSPFAGIGSEGVCSLQQGRRFIGIELKESYFTQACANMFIAEQEQHGDLFALKSA